MKNTEYFVEYIDKVTGVKNYELWTGTTLELEKRYNDVEIISIETLDEIFDGLI